MTEQQLPFKFRLRKRRSTTLCFKRI